MQVKLILVVLASLACIFLSEGTVQWGRRFPLGIQLGGDSPINCTSSEDEGLLRFHNNSVQVCRNAEWTTVASQDVVDDVNEQLLNLTESNEELRGRVVDLEENVYPPLSLESINDKLETNRRQQGIAMCNNHGEYDLDALECTCFCSAAKGCWDTRYECARCAAGWFMVDDLCTGDSEAPVITILGDNPVTIEAGSVYSDAGATAHDNKDLDVTDDIVVSGVDSVDEGVPGTYTVEYDVVDDGGNAAHATRSVVVVDTTRPVITMNGDSVITHEAGAVYTDASAVVTDNAAAIPELQVANSVVDNIPGTYTVVYSCTDQSGNEAISQTRAVVVVDTTNPVISLNGDAHVTHEAGETYFDAGATATDNSAVALPTIDVDNGVVFNVVGTYLVNYTVSDASGNSDFAQRVVDVVDTTDPTIVIIGDGALSVLQFSTYEDDGAFAEDNAEWSELARSNINDGYLVTVQNNVDTSVTGSQTVVYSFTDGAGRSASATRTVVVLDVDECSGAAGGHDCPASTEHCVNVDGTYECHCNSGYSGVGTGEPAAQCTDIDECQVNNGDCDPSAQCTNTVGSRTCECLPPFSGDGLTCATVGSQSTLPADSCQHILEVHQMASVPIPVDGPYWILPSAHFGTSPLQLYCDFSSNAGAAFTLVMKSTSTTPGQSDTGAVAVSAMSNLNVQYSKVNDAFWNALQPLWNWAVCGVSQSFYRWNTAKTWASNHGSTGSCSYNNGYYLSAALTWGGAEVSSSLFDNDACGGAHFPWEGSNNWGVLTGIHAVDTNNYGCHRGGANNVGTAPSVFPSTLSVSSGSWNENGYVLLGTESTCVESDCGYVSNKPIHSCKDLKTLDVLHDRISPSGAYWIKPRGYSGSAEHLFCDMETDGGGWTLVMKISSSSQNQRLTSAVSTSQLSDVSGITAAKVSDSFFNALRADAVWNICNGRQSVYYFRDADVWYSNHGVSASCSYNRNFYSGGSKEPGGTVYSLGQYQACGGAYIVTSGTSWGVLSGIFIGDGSHYGCYSGNGDQTTSAPSMYDAAVTTGASNQWQRDGFILLR